MASSSPLQLIVNADDFGMTPGVNRAVAELHAAGALTSATLMACGAAFHDAIQIARDQPTLGVGCHVVLVDGIPIAPDATSLLLSRGRFTDSMARFAAAVHAGSVRPSDIEHEVAAQIAKLQDVGIAVTHVDTHKHAHLLPRVARAVMRGARRRGVSRIRNPFEPGWCSALSPAPVSRRVPFRMLHKLKGFFDNLLLDEGMQSTDASLGLIATGSLTAEVLQRMLQAAPPGSYELVCHPGYNDEALGRVRTKLRESREIERVALLEVIPPLPPERVQRINFAQLPSGSPGALTKGAQSLQRR